jgi:predicted adenine nucleotide alpha hydrolase (AANH) superfamily ATPase
LKKPPKQPECPDSTPLRQLSTVSPHKNYELIYKIGMHLGARYGLAFLGADFKKQGGYQRSVELSKAYGLYRQRFCGCRFSDAGR